MLAEHEDRYLACLRGEGIRVERDDEPGGGSGGWRLYFAEIGRETFNRISGLCRERAGPEPQIVPATREEYSALYDLNLEAKKCLEARGVPVSEPPSRELWIEESYNDEKGPWSPFDSDAVYPGALEACPQPDLYDVYGIDLYNAE